MSASATDAYVNPGLRRQALRSPSRELEVIVQLRDEVSLDVLEPLCKRLGMEIVRDLPLVNGVVLRLPAAGVLALAASDAVGAVTPNAGVTSTGIKADPSKLGTAYPRAVQAADTWGSMTGAGIGVAVIDSGVQGDQGDFSSINGSRIVASAVVSPGATSPRDTVGHGTHVAGIIAGDSTRRSGDLRGRYVGVAPEANIIAVKVDDDHGGASVADVIAGVQFAVVNRHEFNIRVINMSLSSDVAQPYDVDPLNAAVEAAWFKGIVVVAAAGNRGADKEAVSYAPANDPYVITVGATDDRGTSSIGDDTLATFSSRGRTQHGFTKPDVTAPGARIISALSPGSMYAKECPACVVDRQYLRIGGTSMAAPIVSGVVANLLQGRPTMTPDEVKGALVAGASSSLGIVGQQRAKESKGLANQGLTPNQAIDPSTGEPKNGADWSRSSWSTAPAGLDARWSRSSWSCAQCDGTAETAAEYSRSSWSRSSWSRSSWSAATTR